MNDSGSSAREEAYVTFLLTSGSILDVQRTGKVTPVTLNGGHSSTLTFGRGGGSGARYGLPMTLVHFTHVRRTDLTH